VGSGGVYVATAKRMVYSRVDIDMIAGPARFSSSPTAPPALPMWRPTCWQAGMAYLPAQFL